MTEAGKGVFGWNHTQNHAAKQGREGHKVIAKTPPEKQTKDCAKERKEDDLICCHEGCVARVAKGENRVFLRDTSRTQAVHNLYIHEAYRERRIWGVLRRFQTGLQDRVSLPYRGR